MPKSLTETLNELKIRGYVEDFNLPQYDVEFRSNQKRFENNFQVDEVYRFDEETDPADQSILYAISSKRDSKKGVLVNGYGLYTEQKTNDMVQDLLRP